MAKNKTGKPVRPKRTESTDYFEKIDGIVTFASEKINAFLKSQQATGNYINNVDEFFEQLVTQSEATFTKIMQELSIDMNITHQNKFNESMRTLYGVDITGLIQETGLEETMKSIVEENVNLIKNEFLENSRKGIERTISRALVNGENNNKTLYDLMLKSLPEKQVKNGKPVYMSEKKLKQIARDQTQRFTGALNRIRQQGAGIKTYRWSSSRDARVRPSHRALNGVTVEWATGKIIAAPPNKKKYIGKTTTEVIESFDSSPASDGIHPQQGYNCRCVAIPIIEVQEPVNFNKRSAA